MEPLKLHDAEYRLASIVWDSEPIHSRELAEKCEAQLGWKRTTTYTMLKKLCEKGVLRNDKAQVTALIKRGQIQRDESRAVVEKSFGGSLPDFITAFLTGNKLSEEEAERIRRLIDDHRGE